VKVSDAELKDGIHLNLKKTIATVNNGGWDIKFKGNRPPKAAPPPVIMRSIVDNNSRKNQLTFDGGKVLQMFSYHRGF
ncbi:Hypothetical predicted protein, partial [Olea europaea subsp. europaea]